MFGGYYTYQKNVFNTWPARRSLAGALRRLKCRKSEFGTRRIKALAVLQDPSQTAISTEVLAKLISLRIDRNTDERAWSASLKMSEPGRGAGGQHGAIRGYCHFRARSSWPQVDKAPIKKPVTRGPVFCFCIPRRQGLTLDSNEVERVKGTAPDI
jgi:hypothetical protein